MSPPDEPESPIEQFFRLSRLAKALFAMLLFIGLGVWALLVPLSEEKSWLTMGHLGTNGSKYVSHVLSIEPDRIGKLGVRDRRIAGMDYSRAHVRLQFYTLPIRIDWQLPATQGK